MLPMIRLSLPHLQKIPLLLLLPLHLLKAMISPLMSCLPYKMWAV
jgi:hypothetical protein